MLQKLVHIIMIPILCHALAAHAGDWHQPSQLICSDCHTMHYSEGGMIPMDAETGGPFPQLLLASTTNTLCLACHDGTDTNAPDVVHPVTYAPDAAAGYFANPGGIPSDSAHNLGMASGETSPGGSDSLILSCASCHNPHGNSNYRNLLLDPAGTGNSADVDVIVSQTESPDGPGGNRPADVYVPSNLIYRSGMSNWCNDCHPDFHGASETGSPQPWFRHPQDLTISGKIHADYIHWDSTIPHRVEVESPNDTIVPSTDDQVFCLSCHKAHGSANQSSLIRADGTMLSTCQQCHNQAYESTKHGDAANGVDRIPGEPEGDCTHCHDEHSSRDSIPTPGGPYDYLLFNQNDNDLCYTCHTSAGDDRSYQGLTIYSNSTHATDMDVYWPGYTPPSRPSSDYGECLNCHTPHGREDGLGLIPSLTFSREEHLCQTCHDGSPATDVEDDITKTYRHPADDHTGRHDQSEDRASDFGSSNRHAECVDCHNPHYAKSDVTTPSAPDASDRIKGVSGVQVINGTAGSQPSYIYAPSDIGIDYEYQLCFKCHSSWTTQPADQPDMAMLLNPNNPSYHPIEAEGSNTNIDPRAFVNGWEPTDMMYCTDCHTSDNSLVRGPHGSQYNYLLKKDYDVSTTERAMSSDELCFDCHNYDTYANQHAGGEVKRYSRFGAGKGHTLPRHVGQNSCYTCHDSHASTDKPHLIVTGRSPGLDDYVESSDGGTCSPTCHEQKSYNVTYPR